MMEDRGQKSYITSGEAKAEQDHFCDLTDRTGFEIHQALRLYGSYTQLISPARYHQSMQKLQKTSAEDKHLAAFRESQLCSAVIAEDVIKAVHKGGNANMLSMLKRLDAGEQRFGVLSANGCNKPPFQRVENWMSDSQSEFHTELTINRCFFDGLTRLLGCSTASEFPIRWRVSNRNTMNHQYRHNLKPHLDDNNNDTGREFDEREAPRFSIVQAITGADGVLLCMCGNDKENLAPNTLLELQDGDVVIFIGDEYHSVFDALDLQNFNWRDDLHLSEDDRQLIEVHMKKNESVKSGTRQTFSLQCGSLEHNPPLIDFSKDAMAQKRAEMVSAAKAR